MASSKIKIEIVQTQDYSTNKTTLNEIIADTAKNAWPETYKFYATKVSSSGMQGNMMIIGYKAGESYRSGLVLKHAGTLAGVRAFNGTSSISADLTAFTS